jgi:hypothetical protein
MDVLMAFKATLKIGGFGNGDPILHDIDIYVRQ